MVKLTKRKKRSNAPKFWIIGGVVVCSAIVAIVAFTSIKHGQETSQAYEHTKANATVVFKQNKGKVAADTSDIPYSKKAEKVDYKASEDIERLSWDDLRAFQGSKEERAIVASSNAVIEIPRFKLALPILEGTNTNHLKVGATTFREYQGLTEGNYVLLGHNMGRSGVLFSDVPQLKKGDKIIITQKEGKKRATYTYEVSKKQEVDQKQTSVLENTDQKQLTLITCASEHTTTKRIVVTASPI
ncbi:class A sortase [Listeria booriae]|uniref:Class A sortase n=1 Tax=Listeria booriae TaxID=1552123 RepID=A0A842B7H9_9LIST|nr:class A sortase [Listeria booriae]MBC1798478.1 class A sortase [Listeria booriae]